MAIVGYKFLAYSIFAILSYRIANKRKVKYYWELPLDKKIRVLPIFVIPYLLFFPYVLLSFLSLLSTTNDIANRYITTLFLVQSLALAFWIFFPNGVRRTNLPHSRLEGIVNFLYKHDKDANGFSSGHVFITVISMYFAFFVSTPFGIFMTALGSLIILSTLLIKQHYFIDVIGGILLATLGIVAVL